jgi:hypothetical protein
MRTDHTRRSDRRVGKPAARGGHQAAADRRRPRPPRDRVSPPRRAPPPPSPRGLRRGPPPTATAMAAVLACGPYAALSHRSAAALWRIVPRCHSPLEVTAPTKHRVREICVHRSPLRQRHHPLRDPRRHPDPHARRPRRRPDPKNTHPSPQRSPGPTPRHPRRADHPPHPISRTAHLTTHARTGRHPLTPRRPFTRFLKRHHLPPAERNQQIAGHEVTPPPTPSNKTATATPTSSTRGSPRSASPTTASSTTRPRRRNGSEPS